MFCGICVSCNKADSLDDLDVTGEVFSETPVFQFSDTTSNINIEAGVDDFYMNADYDTLSDGRIMFNSQFIKANDCTNQCDVALRFYIESINENYTNGDVLSNAAISIGDYSFSNSQSLVFGNVTVEYIDEDGISHRSDQVEQTEGHYFKIVSATDYQRNQNGDPTKLIQIQVSCQLKALEEEQVIELLDASGTIAIAYPE
jgi:hypothetical protein